MGEDLGAETGVHGASWGRMHGGYFSDPAVARPLVDAVRAAWDALRPEVVVDLGGGTGFLLSRLREAGLGREAALVNLDCSPAQLDAAAAAGVASVRGSVDGFRREAVVPAGRSALWLMRSVLHYAGEAGLAPLLRHLRAQAKAGERWVHQTACFERPEDADCLNALYRGMRTAKWYPAVADLRERLSAAGWRAVSVLPAPALRLDSGELGLRYGLDEAEIAGIRESIAGAFGGRGEVFRLRPGGFQADLHYRIWICDAVS